MNRFVAALVFLILFNAVFGQTPVPMTSQPGLTYTEDFADIVNWTNNFASGVGANRFSSVAVGGSTSIPSATKITTSSSTFVSGTSGGVQRGSSQTQTTNSIVLLSTGTEDNSTSTAFDFFIDFTGVDAGTISFDWATVFNSTGDRKSSLRIYSSIDGITFSDLTSAFVLNFTNNIATSGSITSVALPASFNNSATARLRFYYHNGNGGASGSRPKISIDNLTVTAVPNTPCVTPTAQPSSLVLSAITSTSIAGDFTAASPPPNSYLVVISNNSSLSSLPVDSITYNLGDNIGDGYVVANGNSLSFSATGLTPLTTYYFYIFSVNNICIGSIKYFTVSNLEGNATTTASFPVCVAPSAQPTNLVFGTTTANLIQGSFTAAAADGYLVLRSTSATLSANPLNASTYASGNIIGNATVVQQSNAISFSATGLSSNTLFYFYVISYNNLNCSNGPIYKITSPLSSSRSTTNLLSCTIPTAQPTNISFTIASTAIAGAFNAGEGNDTYLIIRSLSPTLSATPVNNTDYTVGDNLGGGIVIAINTNKSFLTTGLVANTSYYFYVFAVNKNCDGGTKYLTVNPLEGNATTTNDAVNNYYFGNLHGHSDYSDGNKDNPGYTPYQNYTYAMASQCMDYLGISEHNHYNSNNNPGNKLSTYSLGITQATNFTSANPSFIALYGMEWGVINNGGHVLVYGDGMNNLWGWETGSGGWGSSNNYDNFIAKSDYTGASGLFKTVNDNIGTNTFATLAHPGSNDFDNLYNIAYNSIADAAISGVAVESGPAFSTNTTYSNAASSLSYLSYYQKLLSKGYHVAPTIDHDNHNTTFGRTTYSRSAVVAPSLSKTEIIKGFRNNHVYATQDCDTKVDFTLNTKIMGSSLIAAGAPIISVNITDATTSTTTAVMKLMFGEPGSGINAVVINTATGSTLNYVDNNLANLAAGYYYIDITNGSSRVITAPIWYTRLDGGALPVSFSSFTVQKKNKIVKLSWTTEQEINSSHFIIERSADGRTWKNIASIIAAGNSSNHLSYTAYDNSPFNGTNYYRIKQLDVDGKFQTSVIKNVQFYLGYAISVAPNPTKDFVTISMNNLNSTNSLIQFFDVAGNLVVSKKTNKSTININTFLLIRGLYFIKVTNADQVAMQKIVLQ